MAVPTPDDFEAAGLYDPRDHAGTGRLELLTWLHGQGFTIDEMVHAVETNALGAMAGDRWLVPGDRLERAAAIARSGLSEEVFDAYSIALGFEPIQGAPEGEVGYTSDEIELLISLDALTQLFSRDEAMALLRVISGALSRIAEAAVSLFLADIESPHLLEGRSEFVLGQSVFEAVKLIEGLTQRLDPMFRRHVLQAVERSRRTTIDQIERFQYRYAIGFVDLVGFTSASGHMSAQELAKFVGRFEARAHEVVTGAGARVVKLIGDEVMFVATDPAAACQSGRALIEAFSADHAGVTGVLPRGGLAYGNVVLRGGDYYGTVVNLASRLADEAVPQELLVSDELAHAAVTCRFEPAGRRMIKGFDEPVFVHSMMAG